MDLIQPDSSTLHIEGFPDAVKVIAVHGQLAMQLADLALHRADLIRADEYLNGINLVQEEFLREGLMVAALVRFCKCFGENRARTTVRLDAKAIFGAHKDGWDTYNFFNKVRNKHVVHDENSFSQASVGAALTKRGAPYKIEKVFSFAVNSDLVTQEFFSNLELLIKIAQKWVDAEIERINREVTRELELESYETLLARDALQLMPADLTKFGEKR